MTTLNLSLSHIFSFDASLVNLRIKMIYTSADQVYIIVICRENYIWIYKFFIYRKYEVNMIMKSKKYKCAY